MQPDLLQRSLCYNSPVPVEYIEARVALRLPYDFPASAQSGTQNGLLVVPLAQVPAMYLDDQDLDAPIDFSTRLLVAFCVFLARYTREEVVRLDLPAPYMPGAYHQTIPDRSAAAMAISVDLRSSPTFHTLLQQVKAALHTGHTQRILTALASAESCRFVRFTYQRVVQRYAPVYSDQYLHFDGDLHLDLVETSRGIEARWMYHPGRFSAATIRRMHTHFQTLLASIAAHPGWPVSQLPLMTAAERQRGLALGQNPSPMS